ncbi:Uncharacterised protein [Shigella sonnei]|nr:Uncharacterised protein [Shigella sonnei]
MFKCVIHLFGSHFFSENRYQFSDRTCFHRHALRMTFQFAAQFRDHQTNGFCRPRSVGNDIFCRCA